MATPTGLNRDYEVFVNRLLEALALASDKTNRAKCMGVIERHQALLEERRRLDAVLAWTVEEWCSLNRYSRSFYERMKREGRGPAETREGATVRITPEADREWRATRERRPAEVAA